MKKVKSLTKSPEFLEKNGKNYVRISSLVAPFSNLVGIDEDVLNNKASIGSCVHRMIESITPLDVCSFDVDENEIYNHPPRCTCTKEIQCFGYLSCYWDWFLKSGLTLVASEKRIFDDSLMITGCVDSLFTNGESLFVVDFKTSYSVSPSWEWQGYFYWLLSKEYSKYLSNENKKIKNISNEIYFLKLSETKKAQVIKYLITKEKEELCKAMVKKFWSEFNQTV